MCYVLVCVAKRNEKMCVCECVLLNPSSLDARDFAAIFFLELQ